MTFPGDGPYEIPPSVIAKRLGEEMVIVDLGSGNYFSLNATGAMIWDALASHQTVDALAGSLAEQFDAPREDIERDARELISELLQRGLLRGRTP